jgi:RNA polymerase sigma factor (sigma-70 family)
VSKQVKVPYTLANGKTVWVEVSIQVKRALRASQQQERRQNLEIRDNHAPDEFADGQIERKSQETMLRHEKEIQSLELREAIRQLNPVQRRRLTAYYFEGLTYQEIADLEGISKKNAHKSIVAAEQALKKSMGLG